jgi:hypothetical protein
LAAFTLTLATTAADVVPLFLPKSDAASRTS